MKLQNLIEEIKQDLGKCLKEEVRKETEDMTPLYSLNINQINYIRKKYNLFFNNLFFETFCFLSKNYKNHKDLFKTKMIIRISNINNYDLDNFLRTYSNQSLNAIYQHLNKKGKKGYLEHSTTKERLNLTLEKIEHSKKEHIPPYSSCNYIFGVENSNKKFIVGNEEYLASAIIYENIN